MIGTLVGNYRIESKLGEGGMGTVYRGVEVNLERPVAIKVLNPEFVRKPAIVERFRAEAKAQANLNHPNVATLYAFLTQDDSAMMVMEFVDGENFQQMVNRRGPIPSAEAIPLFRQALAGIGAAHRVGIVHRDVKPANIMLNQQGVVKVMDFGIAKVVGDRGLTRTGSQLGTVYYMSPEQVKGQTADQRSDIYSLGVTLYEMLTAKVPFSAASEFDVLTDHVNTLPALPSTIYANIPRNVENVVLKAMEKRPEDRYQSVEEFTAALANFESWDGPDPLGLATTAEINSAPWAAAKAMPARDMDATRPPPQAAPVAIKPKPRAWAGFAIGMAAVLALGGGAILYFSDKGGPPAAAPTRSAAPPTQMRVQPGSLVPEAVTPPPTPQPVTATIPADTEVAVRLTGAIDGGLAALGQIFPVTVESPIMADGKTLVEAGAHAQVRLLRSQKGGRFKGSGKMELELANVISGGAIYRVASNTFTFDGPRGKFPGFGGGTLKVPAGTPMSFALSEPLIVTLH